jgi:hypothetical protein
MLKIWTEMCRFQVDILRPFSTNTHSYLHINMYKVVFFHAVLNPTMTSCASYVLDEIGVNFWLSATHALHALISWIKRNPIT